MHQFNFLGDKSTTFITNSEAQSDEKIIDSVSWMIANKNGQLETSSGFNAFDGSTKLPLDIRKEKITKIKEKFSSLILNTDLNYIISALEEVLLRSWTQSAKDINEKKLLRTKLIVYISRLNNQSLIKLSLKSKHVFFSELV